MKDYKEYHWTTSAEYRLGVRQLSEWRRANAGKSKGTEDKSPSVRKTKRNGESVIVRGGGFYARRSA